MDKNTFYNSVWEDPSQYPEFASWVTKTGSRSLSNMGADALKSHVNGNKKSRNDKSKHQKNMEAFIKNSKGQSKITFGAKSSPPAVDVVVNSSSQSDPG